MTTQRQQKHPAGSFPVCPTCNFEPRHILDVRHRPLGGHLMSCACGDTPKHDSLADAVRSWCRARNVSLTVRPVASVTALPRQVAP